jgi:hypothetical protein
MAASSWFREGLRCNRRRSTDFQSVRPAVVPTAICPSFANPEFRNALGPAFGWAQSRHPIRKRGPPPARLSGGDFSPRPQSAGQGGGVRANQAAWNWNWREMLRHFRSGRRGKARTKRSCNQSSRLELEGSAPSLPAPEAQQGPGKTIPQPIKQAGTGGKCFVTSSAGGAAKPSSNQSSPAFASRSRVQNRRFKGAAGGFRVE